MRSRPRAAIRAQQINHAWGQSLILMGTALVAAALIGALAARFA